MARWRRGEGEQQAPQEATDLGDGEGEEGCWVAGWRWEATVLLDC